MLALSALGLTACNVLWNVVTGRRKADAEYVAELERRVDQLEKRIKECEDDRARLGDENLKLMRRVLDLERPPRRRATDRLTA